MEETEIKKLKDAGEIARQVKKFTSSIVKKGISLLDLADKIENKIFELGGSPAFPVNLSINEIAAHSTPSHDDKTLASGLLKVDIGVHIDGYIADTALSFDLENSEKNKKLIKAAEDALERAVKLFRFGAKLREIGSEIENQIKKNGFEPIRNLSGHTIEHYNLHAGISVPNHDNFSEYEIKNGVYAIEPFATSGAGKVIDGKLSGIYHLEKSGNVRDNFAREILNYIKENYKTLPFCARWLVKKFDPRALTALKRIEEAGLLHHYPQLIEASRKPVAQAEHTLIIDGKEKIVTT